MNQTKVKKGLESTIETCYYPYSDKKRRKLSAILMGEMLIQLYFFKIVFTGHEFGLKRIAS